MNYQQFLNEVKGRIMERLPDDYQVNINTVTKNNGISLQALTIIRPDVNVSPTIYLNPYYHQYLENVPMSVILDDIMFTYEKFVPDHDIDIDSFLDYKKARAHLVIKLINTARNKSLLEDCPNVEFLDLSIVFLYVLQEKDLGKGTILIHNSHMEQWKIKLNELFKDALLNSAALLPPRFDNLISILKECMRESNHYCGKDILEDLPLFSSEYELDLAADENPMYVLTNPEKNLGAAVMLYPGLLKSIAEQFGSDMILLPSSIHEMLVIPVDSETGSCDMKMYSEMVASINETELEDEEILSDHCYYYNRTNGMLSNGKQMHLVL